MNTYQSLSDTLKFKENLTGRIANLAMKPSYANTLIPLFEAVMNSLHSIQDRFGDDWQDNCHIEIHVLEDKNLDTHSFKVFDNGIGLNEKNFDSFRTYDSRMKVSRGGKGVGRLTWLKVFEEVDVSSVFQVDSQKFRRTFKFLLDNDAAFQMHEVVKETEETELLTCIALRHLKNGYKNFCTKRLETIAKRVAAHFLPFLIGATKPKIIVKNCIESIDLVDVVTRNIHQIDTESFELEDLGKFEVKHLYVDRTLIEAGTEHTLYLTAHDRIVKDHGINNQIGLNSHIYYKENQSYYIGLVSSKFLDDNVTQERNNFDFTPDDNRAITRKAECAAINFLHDPIDRLLESKTKKIEEVISNFPRFSYIVPDCREFARKMPLNRKSEEEIYKELSVYDYRASRDVKKDMRNLVGDAQNVTDSVEFENKVQGLMTKIGQQEQAYLAEYVSKRKLVIDLLQQRLGFEDAESKTLHKERAIHQIFCPLNVSSGNLGYGSHNLWLIDDRLAYYDFWTSDKSIQSFVKTTEAKMRPDLILFKGTHLLRRKGTNQPVVIIEFKRPGRTDYSGVENPVRQILNYIEELRNTSVSDNNGALITEIGIETPFFCYIIADLTPSLRRELVYSGINQTLPGGRGYYGYNDTLRAYIEVLEYEKIVDDARIRHEAFFRKLGIN